LSNTTPSRVQDLVNRFGSVTTVGGISLEMEPSECFGLVGPKRRGQKHPDPEHCAADANEGGAAKEQRDVRFTEAIADFNRRVRVIQLSGEALAAIAERRSVSGEDLSSVMFIGDVRNVNLSGANLRKSRVIGSVIDCRVDNADLENFRVLGPSVSGSTFIHSNLHDSEMPQMQGLSDLPSNDSHRPKFDETGFRQVRWRPVPSAIGTK